MTKFVRTVGGMREKNPREVCGLAGMEFYWAESSFIYFSNNQILGGIFSRAYNHILVS